MHTHIHTQHTHTHRADPHIETTRMESIISGHKQTVFLVTQLPGCSLRKPAPSQLHFQPRCSCSRSLFSPRVPLLFLCLRLAYIICIFLPSPLSPSLTHCLSLPLITFLLGARGFLITDIIAAFQRQWRFTGRSNPTISPPSSPSNICLCPSLCAPPGQKRQDFLFFFSPATHLPFAISPS